LKTIDLERPSALMLLRNVVYNWKSLFLLSQIDVTFRGVLLFALGMVMGSLFCCEQFFSCEYIFVARCCIVL